MSLREQLVQMLGGGTTALAIVVAAIGLAGALGGALTSYFVASKSVFVTAITAQRMAWIADLKQNISLLLSHLTMVRSHIQTGNLYEQKDLVKTFESMNQLSRKIELQLNPFGDIDQNLICLIKEIYVSVSAVKQSDLEKLCDALLEHSRWMLKAEWERVKYEARGPFGKLASIPKLIRLRTRYRKYSKDDNLLQKAIISHRPILA